jgi:hypothetical protein
VLQLADRILEVVAEQPGITDRWLADALFGRGSAQQRVNGECRRLADQKKIIRRKRDDGLIGNFLYVGEQVSPIIKEQLPSVLGHLSEDRIKEILNDWLKRNGWESTIAWGRSRGVDIGAIRNNERWLIEVKGQGSLDAMRVNYFLAMLGEILQRMNDPKALYSIALPDIKQFRNLWARLPALAKQRTTITALFVSEDGKVELVT